MRLRIFFLTFFCVTIISCRQTEKSNEVMKEALGIYLSSELADSIKIEKSLELTNRALDLDNESISALTHKTTLLFRKRDIDGLLQTIDDLIKLRPEKPYYLVQKAIYLELNGDNSIANEYYDSAFNKYQKHLKIDSLDFNLWLEYVGLLEVTGDTTSASETLARMDSTNFGDSQKEMLSIYRTKVHKSQLLSKAKLRKYWTGEIGYEQIEEK
jgi:tetratricopeptide (TPR) repeat protein